MQVSYWIAIIFHKNPRKDLNCVYFLRSYFHVLARYIILHIAFLYLYLFVFHVSTFMRGLLIGDRSCGNTGHERSVNIAYQVLECWRNSYH